MCITLTRLHNAKDLPADTRITQDMVIELMDANRNMKYQDQEILDAAVQEYKVDSQYQMDPVGIQASHLEGNFLNILQRKTFYRNLNKCFEVAGINVPYSQRQRSARAAHWLILALTPRRFPSIAKTSCAILLSSRSAATISPRISPPSRWKKAMPRR